MTQAIIDILKSIGIYTRARQKFETDEALAEAFDTDFYTLVEMFL